MEIISRKEAASKGLGKFLQVRNARTVMLLNVMFVMVFALNATLKIQQSIALC